jgi:hypothetical protein
MSMSGAGVLGSGAEVFIGCTVGVLIAGGFVFDGVGVFVLLFPLGVLVAGGFVTLLFGAPLFEQAAKTNVITNANASAIILAL